MDPQTLSYYMNTLTNAYEKYGLVFEHIRIVTWDSELLKKTKTSAPIFLKTVNNKNETSQNNQRKTMEHGNYKLKRRSKIEIKIQR